MPTYDTLVSKTDFRRTLNFDPIEEVLHFTLDNVIVFTPDNSAFFAIILMSPLKLYLYKAAKEFVTHLISFTNFINIYKIIGIL